MFEGSTNIEPLFVVTNIDLATYGSITHWRNKLAIAPVKRDEVEKQVTSHWMFLEFEKRIVSLDLAIMLLKIQKRNEKLSERMDSIFNDQTGFYLNRRELNV